MLPGLELLDPNPVGVTLESDGIALEVVPEWGAMLSRAAFSSCGKWHEVGCRAELKRLLKGEAMPGVPEGIPPQSQGAIMLVGPWMGRIVQGKIPFHGDRFEVVHPRKFALHGMLQYLRFSVVEQSATRIRMHARSTDHRLGGRLSPFVTPFAITVEYSLADSGFEISAMPENHHPVRAMPWQFMPHPFFHRSIAAPDELPLFHVPGAKLWYPKISREMPNPQGLAAPVPPEFDCQSPKAISVGKEPPYAEWDQSYPVEQPLEPVGIIWPQAALRCQIEDLNQTTDHVHCWGGRPDWDTCAVELQQGLVGRMERREEFGGHGVVMIPPNGTLPKPVRLRFSFSAV